MAGFTSMDDFINQVTTNGKFWRTDWNKSFLPTSAAVGGEWHCLLRGAGNPGADTVMNAGANLTFQPLNSGTTGINNIPIGPDAGGVNGYKQILNVSAYSAAATTMPAILMLVDLLGFYRVTTTTTTGDQATTNTLSLPRYVDGKGVQAFAYNNNATPMGAATPNLSITYTPAGGGTGITPGVLPLCKTAAANGLILYSGTGAGKYGPFMPLADNTTGIVNITKINLSASYLSGEFSVVLCKPLLTIPMTTIGVPGERDMMNQIPSLPKVYDGACLGWLLYSGAATPVNSSFYGHIDFGWS